MDRGAWRATVHGVAQSRTPLKRLGTHSGKLLYSAGIPAWHAVMTWGWGRGWDGGEGWGLMGGRFKREGIYVYLWLIHVIV